MKLAVIKLPYRHKPTDTEIAAVRAALILKRTLPDVDSDGEWKNIWEHFIVDLTKMPNIPFEVIEMPELNKGSENFNITPRGGVLNQKVFVEVPNLGLMYINEVEVRTDLCTDELQRALNSGWRILAICPQPDQRRPDYILGRYDADAAKHEILGDHPDPFPKGLPKLPLRREETSKDTLQELL